MGLMCKSSKIRSGQHGQGTNGFERVFVPPGERFNINEIFVKTWSPKMMLVHCQTSNPMCEHVDLVPPIVQEILGI